MLSICFCDSFRGWKTKNGRDSSSASTSSGNTDPFERFILAQLLNAYVQWSFKTSLPQLLLSLTVLFYIFTLSWAVVLYVFGKYRPSCIYVGSDNFDTGGSYFSDAYQLSWTTFSTVVRNKSTERVGVVGNNGKCVI